MQLFILLVIALVLTAVAVGVVSAMGVGLVLVEPSPVKDRLARLKHAHEAGSSGAWGGGKPESANRVTLNIQTSGQSKYTPHLERYGIGRWLLSLLAESRQTQPVDEIILKVFIIPIAAGLLLCVLTRMILLVPLIAVVPGIKIVQWMLKRNQRKEALLRQFPDALTLLASGMRAGHAFSSALQMCASEVPAPLNVELSQLSQDVNLGMTLQDSFAKLQPSVGFLPDFQLFATAVIIQRETGGNLAEVLDQLAVTIRERFKLKGQIASLTAQPRMTGYLLGAAPVILLVVLSLVSYGYVSPLFDTALGNGALIVAFIVQGIGFLVIRKIIDIRL
jgi:Flp pilus assembly protein TadB